jgi:hypothetical protein
VAKVTVTVPINRAGHERELSVTREKDSGPLEVFLPPAARQASAVFYIDPEDLADLAAQFAPPEPVLAHADLIAAISANGSGPQPIAGQTTIYTVDGGLPDAS